MTILFLHFLFGLILLYIGAEGLVRGAVRLASLLRVQPLIIGLTVVAFGTSMPEFIVSLLSALSESSDIAMGNVLGSNIANIGLILAIAALLRPVDIGAKSISLHYPVMLIATVLFFFFAFADAIRFVHGIIFLLGIFSFTAYLVSESRNDPEFKTTSVHKIETHRPKGKILLYFVMTIIGSVLLLVGSKILVDSGIEIARAFGVSELTIGVTIIAVGTSLPELAATVVAVVKRKGEIIIGNILGSNIFNILFVIGGVSVIHPITVNPSSRIFEFPVMLAFTLVLPILMRSGFIISRKEGAFLFLCYGVFVYFLF